MKDTLKLKVIEIGIWSTGSKTRFDDCAQSELEAS